MTQEQGVAFIVTERESNFTRIKEGWGKVLFRCSPRIGEMVTRKVDDVDQAYLVLNIIHSSDPNGNSAGEIVVKNVGETSKVHLKDQRTGQ
jgi:hypothetical protein